MHMEASDFVDTASDRSGDSAATGSDSCDAAAKAEAPQGPYQTLRVAGPQTSEGSDGHPDNCTPCTFYCFARRGCSRGTECKFCHLSHQSKLRLRREAWKEQQREKRRAAREQTTARVMEPRRPQHDSQGGPRMPHPSQRIGGVFPKGAADEEAQPIALFDLLGRGEVRAPAVLGRPAAPRGRADSEGVFQYQPGRATMAIGQVTEFKPSVEGPVRRFSPVVPLPADFSLNAATGVITASPTSQFSHTTLVVEAELFDGRTLRGMLQVDSVDFSLGGYVLGHMSEVAPGRYMMLLYVPEGDSASEGPPPTNMLPNSTEATANVGPMLLGMNAPLAWKGGPDQQEPQRWLADHNDPNGLIQKLASGDCSLLETDTLGHANLGTALAPTLGSLTHAMGQCKPCAFVFKEDGCQSGIQCKFCHLCDQGEKRRRMKERKEVRKAAAPEPPAASPRRQGLVLERPPATF